MQWAGKATVQVLSSEYVIAPLVQCAFTCASADDAAVAIKEALKQAAVAAGQTVIRMGFSMIPVVGPIVGEILAQVLGMLTAGPKPPPAITKQDLDELHSKITNEMKTHVDKRIKDSVVNTITGKVYTFIDHYHDYYLANKDFINDETRFTEQGLALMCERDYARYALLKSDLDDLVRFVDAQWEDFVAAKSAAARYIFEKMSAIVSSYTAAYVAHYAMCSGAAEGALDEMAKMKKTVAMMSKMLQHVDAMDTKLSMILERLDKLEAVESSPHRQLAAANDDGAAENDIMGIEKEFSARVETIQGIFTKWYGRYLQAVQSSLVFKFDVHGFGYCTGNEALGNEQCEAETCWQAGDTPDDASNACKGWDHNQLILPDCGGDGAMTVSWRTGASVTFPQAWQLRLCEGTTVDGQPDCSDDNESDAAKKNQWNHIQGYMNNANKIRVGEFQSGGFSKARSVSCQTTDTHPEWNDDTEAKFSFLRELAISTAQANAIVAMQPVAVMGQPLARPSLPLHESWNRLSIGPVSFAALAKADTSTLFTEDGPSVSLGKCGDGDCRTELLDVPGKVYTLRHQCPGGVGAIMVTFGKGTSVWNRPVRSISMYGRGWNSTTNTAIPGVEPTPCYTFEALDKTAAEETSVWSQYIPSTHTIESFSYRVDDATETMRTVQFELVWRDEEHQKAAPPAPPAPPASPPMPPAPPPAPPVAPPPAPPQRDAHVLRRGEKLIAPCVSWHATCHATDATRNELISPNGDWKAVLQQDGNFVVFNAHDGAARWALYTQSGVSLTGDPWKNKVASIELQGNDGNLVIRNAAAQNDLVFATSWESSHRKNPDGFNPGTGDELVMQDDGNLVLYRNGGKVMWASDD